MRSLLHILITRFFYLNSTLKVLLGPHCGLSDKESSANAGDMGSIPESGRSPGEGIVKSSILNLGNPIDREAWWAIVHGITRVRYDLATKQQ